METASPVKLSTEKLKCTRQLRQLLFDTELWNFIRLIGKFYLCSIKWQTWWRWLLQWLSILFFFFFVNDGGNGFWLFSREFRITAEASLFHEKPKHLLSSLHVQISFSCFSRCEWETNLHIFAKTRINKRNAVHLSLLHIFTLCYKWILMPCLLKLSFLRLSNDVRSSELPGKKSPKDQISDPWKKKILMLLWLSSLAGKTLRLSWKLTLNSTKRIRWSISFTWYLQVFIPNATQVCRNQLTLGVCLSSKHKEKREKKNGLAVK